MAFCLAMIAWFMCAGGGTLGRKAAFRCFCRERTVRKDSDCCDWYFCKERIQISVSCTALSAVGQGWPGVSLCPPCVLHIPVSSGLLDGVRERWQDPSVARTR